MPPVQLVWTSRVRLEIGEADLSSYRRAADFLNVNQVDVVSVQHEYGIFGGKAGVYVLETRGRHLGVDGSMIFHNRFVSQAELTEFLSAADVGRAIRVATASSVTCFMSHYRR